jgi:parallel beta-helix repeat protein
LVRIRRHPTKLAPIGALALTALLTLAIASASAKAPADQLHCGDTISRDTTLQNDLIDCPGDGLVIGADDVTLDLAGHTIDGVGQGNGVAVGAPVVDAGGTTHDVGYDRVTIENGTVRDFHAGVGLVGSFATHVKRLTSYGSTFGIDVYKSGDAVVERSNLHNNDYGVIEDFSSHMTVESNHISNNRAGVSMAKASWFVQGNYVSGNSSVGIIGGDGGGPIEYNVVVENGGGRQGRHEGDGIVLQAAASGPVAHNRVLRNTGDGIAFDNLFESGVNPGNQITDNTTSGNGRDGIYLFDAEGTLVEGNRSYDNARYGTFLDLSAGVLMQRNTTNRNGDDGIHAERGSYRLTENTANRNVDLGIEAGAPDPMDSLVIDGGGNRAFGNGNPLQCLNVACGR